MLFLPLGVGFNTPKVNGIEKKLSEEKICVTI